MTSVSVLVHGPGVFQNQGRREGLPQPEALVAADAWSIVGAA